MDVTASVDPFDSASFAASTIHLLASGTCLGERFEIVRPLDSGGYSVVYLANDRTLQRPVALKVLRADRTSEHAVERFKREAAVARDVVHPHLVRIFDLEVSDGAMYLTMEYIEGESLRRRLERGPMSVEEAHRIASQLFSALDTLHTSRIVHRDIKPGNILLDAGGDAKLTDFGLARQLFESSNRTVTGALVGTLDYVSPEQVRGRQADERSDLYSAGIVVFEMLAGRSPYDAASVCGALLARMKTPPDVRTFRSDCPGWLAGIVAKLIAPDPKQRYQSAEEALSDLQRRRRRKVRPYRLMIAAGVAAMLSGGGVVALRSPRHDFSHLIATEHGIAAVDESGSVLWRKDNVHAAAASEVTTLARWNGAKILVSASPSSIVEGLPSRKLSLAVLDPRSGALIRTINLPETAWSFPEATDSYVIDTVKAVDLDDDGWDEIVVSCTHLSSWESYTLVYEPRLDRVRVVFLASGHHRFVTAADIDGDGRRDLVLTGVNNRLGWVNALAVVKVGGPASTPDSWRAGASTSLLWYALLPRGFMTHDARVDIRRDSVVFRFPNGQAFALGRDGMRLQGPHDRRAIEARTLAYDHLREGDRLRVADVTAAAADEMRKAISFARITQDPLLIETMQRRYGAFLIASGNIAAGERLLDELARESPNASEIAYYDAALELHKRGALEKAVQWYLRGIGLGGRPDEGKSKQDFLEGSVLALVELRRFNDALAAISRFNAAYPAFTWYPEFCTEYVRWRAGWQTDPNFPITPNRTDFERYAQLEFSYVGGVSAERLLGRIDRGAETRSEVRSALLSLHADLLNRLGRREEARQTISRAVDWLREDQSRSILARAHATIVRQRYDRLARTN